MSETAAEELGCARYIRVSLHSSLDSRFPSRPPASSFCLAPPVSFLRCTYPSLSTRFPRPTPACRVR